MIDVRGLVLLLLYVWMLVLSQVFVCGAVFGLLLLQVCALVSVLIGLMMLCCCERSCLVCSVLFLGIERSGSWRSERKRSERERSERNENGNERNENGTSEKVEANERSENAGRTERAKPRNERRGTLIVLISVVWEHHRQTLCCRSRQTTMSGSHVLSELCLQTAGHL